MRRTVRFIVGVLRLGALSVCIACPAFAAATLSQQVDPPEANVGDRVVVTLTVQGGSVGDLRLPTVDGLQVVGTQSNTNITFSNGTLSRSLALNFAVIPSRTGDLVIPAFEIHTQEGDVLHAKAMTIHVLGNIPAATNSVTTSAAPAPAMTGTTPQANSNGPVVMPPAAPPQTPTPPNFESSADTGDFSLAVPHDADGTPSKIFLIITPELTDAYVGESVPLRIDFYLRMDSYWDQNSLPTIKGSDFLMNNFITRGHMNTFLLQGQQYERESWLTAITAPKSGDFALVMRRNSYWVKSINPNRMNFFGQYFNPRPNLAHEDVTSNQLTMHVIPLPTEGQPAHFTGAIGQFQVTGGAQPSSVALGEPLTLNFSVAGAGNFDYVRCPVLPENPAWKTYVPSSKTNYRDESHVHAIKVFEEAVIPTKNGQIQLPAATFSYFDPIDKKYVTTAVALPEITVTGTALPVASTPAGPANDATSIVVPPQSQELKPNRLDAGSTLMSLLPVYRQSWYWIAQWCLVALPLLGLLLLFLRSRATPVNDQAERELRQRFRQQEEDAMSDAVQRKDAVAFFFAARHAIQLQLGTQWNVKPEALTLGEIRARDPQLAENLEPLFAKADEVIYSGRASANLDLAEWERRAREILQLQPA